MSAYCKAISKLSEWMYSVSGFMLTCLMLLVVTDVILRTFGKPLPGTYELVGLAGAVVAGFAIPQTTLLKGHVYVEFLIDRMDKDHRAVVLFAVKIIVFLLFVAFGVYIVRMALDMMETQEVTQNLRIPFYPVALVVGACCFIECLALISDMIKLVRGEYE